MSSIERLKIQGIRSFGPDRNDEAVIKFSSPLTLILGQNGCGKTTIIEALKYACCGELPSGTDGGSGFVHDPKLAGMNEVKGNVKLKCRDMKGKAVTVSRTVRVIQKYRKLEFKSIDASFTTGEGASRQETFSGKCVDIDAIMCQTLGTSQAVLTNVIFCHQEDSLWPLEKGKKVKEKFDAIFGITEYNKCLDYFRSMSKELDSKKTLVKKDVEFSSKFWEEAKEKRKKLDDFKAKAAANRDCIDEVNVQMNPIIDQIREIVEKESNFAVHMSKITDKRNRRQLINETIEETRKDIREEFFGSKDALLNEIHSFETRLKETTDKLDDLASEKMDLQTEESRIQKEIDSKTMLMGQLQSAEVQHREKIEMRNIRLRNLGHELEVNVVSNSQLNESSSVEVLRNIEVKIKNREEELKEMQGEQKRFEIEIQNKIDASREKKATLTQDVKTKQKAIENNRCEIEKVENEIREVDRSGEKLVTLENNLKQVNSELNEAMASLDVDQCKAGIEKANDDIKKLEDKSVALDKEIKQLLQVSVEKANLDKLCERKKTLVREWNSLKEKHCDSLKHLLSSMPENDFKRKLQTRMNQLNDDIREHETTIIRLDQKLSVLKEQKRNVEEQIKQKNKKVTQDEDRIEELCADQNIQTYYDNVTSKLQHVNDTRGMLSASQFMFKKYVEKLQVDEPICPLCRRDFDNRGEVQEVLEDLQRRIDEIPRKMNESEIEIKKLSDTQRKAAGLLPLHESIKTMRTNEIPKLRTELSNIDKQIQEIENELLSHKNDLIVPQTDREMASRILTDCVIMDQHMQEIQVLESDIEKLKSKMPSTTSSKTLEEATDEQDVIKSDLANLRKKLNNDQRDLSSYNERVNKLRERKTELTAQQLKIVGGVQQRKILVEKLEDLKLLQMVQQKELEQAQAQLEPISEQLEQMNGTLCQMRAKHELLLDEKRKAITELEKRIDEIRTLQTVIADYAKKGGSARLMKTRDDLAEKKQHKARLESRKTQLEKELELNKTFQNTHELQKRDLDANLKLRNKKEELGKVEDELKELEGHVKILNFEQLGREKRELEKKKRNLEDTKAKAEGKQQIVMANIRDVERELNQNHYKNAEEQYRLNNIKLSITVKAIEDLKLYEKAMDWAMIHFHKERMKMINTIIRELWRQIYRGNDIDYIEIKTDEGTSTASGRRTYNYKVIQVKNGIELDMPGRCSAGQKVLACLIIRMALAETFCKNCGILALDEPTTNLDRTNVESLSEALADIVERRSVQRNFQLLVITHDEEFLRRLFDAEKVDSYLEVRRDDKGKSQVIQRSR